MFVVGLGTAVPPKRYRQRECYEALESSTVWESLRPRSRAILRKVLLGANGIETRHLALDPLSEAFTWSPDVLHARFTRHAASLASEAAQRALADAGCTASEIDAVIISTCTGYLCPGLTSYVSERLGLPPQVYSLDLVGQGCAAALPNWRTAEALLAGHRATRVLSICVEVCSAAIYFDDDTGVLISACLFGDGAGAAVLSREPLGQGRQVSWMGAASVLQPEHRDLLRFEQKNGLLRNLLTPQVPALAAEAVEFVLGRVVEVGGIQRSRINGWILHPGGRDVLEAVRGRLGLGTGDLRWSAEVLREYGNISSASVYFILQRAMASSSPGGYWLMASFGAGFSCHGALLRVEDSPRP